MFRTFLLFVHVCVSARVRLFSSSCDYFSPLCLLSFVRESKRKQQITRSEFFHIFVYRFSSLLLLLLSYLLFFLSKRPTNVHCDWCVSSLFTFALSHSLSFFCCCLMMFYVCKCARVCVVCCLQESDRKPFLDSMENKKEMVTCPTTHTQTQTHTRRLSRERKGTKTQWKAGHIRRFTRHGDT